LWAPVFDILTSSPTGVLAKVLSSPLMAGLAKDTFAADDPGLLATLSTRSQIETRLIDGYVAATYHNALGRADDRKDVKMCYYDPRDAARWLATLAYLGYLNETRDLRWWRLPWMQLVVPPTRWRELTVASATIFIAFLGSGLGSIGWAVVAVVVGVFVGVAAWVFFRVVFGWVFAHEFQAGPWWERRRRSRQVARGFAKYVGFGIICGALAGMLLSDLTNGAIAGLVCGAASAAIPSPNLRRSPNGPADTLRINHILSIAMTAKHAIIAAVVFAATGYLVGADVQRWALVGTGTFVIASLAGSEANWLRFRFCHIVVALAGLRKHTSLLPLRLIRFLNDGTHPDRATLRVNGNAWQFRHAKIQDHLVRRGQLAVVRRRVDAGDAVARLELARLLREHGGLDEVAASPNVADIDGLSTTSELASLRREQADVEETIAELARIAKAGSKSAKRQLARRLRKQSTLDEVIGVLRRLADAGNPIARDGLIHLLRKQGQPDEAIAALRRFADARDWGANRELARLLYEQGNLDEAVTVLRRASDAGVAAVRRELARLLYEQSNLDEAIVVLRLLADAGDRDSRSDLARLLYEQGHLDQAVAVLLRFANAGDTNARWHLTQLLREQGHLDQAIAILRHFADAGDVIARSELARLLHEQDNLQETIAELRRAANAGDAIARSELARLLHDQGNLDEAIAVLRRAADTGDPIARSELARLLHDQGSED